MGLFFVLMTLGLGHGLHATAAKVEKNFVSGFNEL